MAVDEVIGYFLEDEAVGAAFLAVALTDQTLAGQGLNRVQKEPSLRGGVPLFPGPAQRVAVVVNERPRLGGSDLEAGRTRP